MTTPLTKEDAQGIIDALPICAALRTLADAAPIYSALCAIADGTHKVVRVPSENEIITTAYPANYGYGDAYFADGFRAAVRWLLEGKP